MFDLVGLGVIVKMPFPPPDSESIAVQLRPFIRCLNVLQKISVLQLENLMGGSIGVVFGHSSDVARKVPNSPRVGVAPASNLESLSDICGYGRHSVMVYLVHLIGLLTYTQQFSPHMLLETPNALLLNHR